DFDVISTFARLALGQPHTADFGIAVSTRGHMIVVERPRLLASNAFGCDDAFGRRHVRELRVPRDAESNDVADRRNPADARSIFSVDSDVALFELQADALRIETGRHRTTA